MKYKVGDKVILVNGIEDYIGLSGGEIGIIKEGSSFSDGWLKVIGKDKKGEDFEKGMKMNDTRWELVKKLKEPKIFIFRK